MGSFNLSCIATRQTISSGDPSRVILIRDASAMRSRDIVLTDAKGIETTPRRAPYIVGTAARWSPASPAFKAKYDDYGQFVLLPSEEAKASAYLKSIAVYLVDCKNHDEFFSIADFKSACLADTSKAWSMLMDAANRNLLYSKSIHSDGCQPIAIAAMHESAYRHLVDNAVDTFGDPISASKIAKAVADAADRDLVDPETDRFKSKGFPMVAWHNVGEALRENHGAFHPFPDIERTLIIAFVEKYQDSPSPEARRQLIAEIVEPLEGTVLLRAMDEMCLALEPAQYAGQDYNNDLGRKHARMVAAVEQEVSARYSEDEDDLPSP